MILGFTEDLHKCSLQSAINFQIFQFFFFCFIYWCPNVQHALSLISLSIHLFPIFENDPYHLKCFILVLVLLSCVKKVHTINFYFDFELRLFSEISWIFDNQKKQKKKRKGRNWLFKYFDCFFYAWWRYRKSK